MSDVTANERDFFLGLKDLLEKHGVEITYGYPERLGTSVVIRFSQPTENGTIYREFYSEELDCSECQMMADGDFGEEEV